MATGTVKFFNTDRGYGFITNEAGGPDASHLASSMTACLSARLMLL